MGGAIAGAVVCIAVGIACFVIGIANMRGNISMLHSYHVGNIDEEKRLPFGKLIGKGMIVISCAIVAYGGLFIPAELTQDGIYTVIANIVMAVGMVVGLGICLYAIKKYNGRIID